MPRSHRFVICRRENQAVGAFLFSDLNRDMPDYAAQLLDEGPAVAIHRHVHWLEVIVRQAARHWLREPPDDFMAPLDVCARISLGRRL